MPVRRFLISLLTLFLLASSVSANAGELTLEEVRRVFPTAQSITLLNGKVPAYAVRGERGQLGFAFTTGELAPISAYSGKPINTVVGLGEDGLIKGVEILHHEEPILVIGVSDDDLNTFIAQFVGKKTTDRVRVGAHRRAGYNFSLPYWPRTGICLSSCIPRAAADGRATPTSQHRSPVSISNPFLPGPHSVAKCHALR